MDDNNGIAPPQDQVRRRIERLAFQARRTAKSASPESVHDLRVAIRRTDQALVTLKLHFPRKPAKRIRKQLKELLSVAGAVRDLDIATEILSRTKQPGAAELLRQIRGRRKTSEKSLLTGLKRLSLRTRVSKWCDDLSLSELQGDFETELHSLAMSRLPRLAKRFFDAGRAAASQHSAQKLHEFRIRAKKFRYTLELFAPLYGPKVTEWTSDIKSVQNILGAMNDYRSVLSLAAAFGSGRKLKAALKRSERRKINQFRKVWMEQFSDSAATEWIRLLRQPPEQPRIRRKPVARAAAHARRAVAVTA